MTLRFEGGECGRKIITLPVNQSQSKGICVDVKVRIRRRGNLRQKLTSADWETNLSIKSGAVLPTGKESAALDDAIQHSPLTLLRRYNVETENRFPNGLLEIKIS